MDMKNILEQLATAENRPIFHSEADFQHALAWGIHGKHKSFNIRLEYKFAFAPDKYIDMVIKDEKNKPIVAMELKYKTKNTPEEIDCNGEIFILKNQVAHDHGRYDFWRDVRRVEMAVMEEKIVQAGYVIFLTNDSSYWNQSKEHNTSYDFRIEDNREIQQGVELRWSRFRDGKNPKVANEGERTESIKLKGKYKLEWAKYKEVSGIIFKYLLLKVCNDNEAER